jgi:hypothetical protein
LRRLAESFHFVVRTILEKEKNVLIICFSDSFTEKRGITIYWAIIIYSIWFYQLKIVNCYH